MWVPVRVQKEIIARLRALEDALKQQTSARDLDQQSANDTLDAIENALKQQTIARSVDQQSANNEYRGAAAVIASAIKTVAEEGSNYEKPQRDKELRLQKRVVSLTLVTAVGAIIAAVASWITLLQVRDSTAIAARALAENQKQFKSTLQEMKEQTAISEDALHVSERAYIVTSTPILDSFGNVSIPMTNLGHIPSGHMDVVVHEATLDISHPDNLFRKPRSIFPTEAHWKRQEAGPLSPTVANYNVIVPLPKYSAEKFNAGTQMVIVVGTISYQDGFPKYPVQEWHFCYETSFNVHPGPTSWGPCDWKERMDEIERSDHYPKDEYHGPPHI